MNVINQRHKCENLMARQFYLLLKGERTKNFVGIKIFTTSIFRSGIFVILFSVQLFVLRGWFGWFQSFRLFHTVYAATRLETL